MRIDRILGIFNCLSCGYRGNIFFKFGVEINRLDTTREKLRRKIKELQQDRFSYPLPKDAIQYLGSWRGISPKTYLRFQAFKSSEKEFINRVVFPIRDVTGRTVCFIGRDDTGTLAKKYYIHPGGTRLPLYPSVLPTKGKVCIVEGIFDMLNLQDKDMINVITTFGVNNVREDTFNDLKLQGITGVDILFDNDDAGKSGALAAQAIIEKAGLATRIVEIPDGMKDPGELNVHQVHKLRNYLYG
jgi:DNA primase